MNNPAVTPAQKAAKKDWEEEEEKEKLANELAIKKQEMEDEVKDKKRKDAILSHVNQNLLNDFFSCGFRVNDIHQKVFLKTCLEASNLMDIDASLNRNIYPYLDDPEKVGKGINTIMFNAISYDLATEPKKKSSKLYKQSHDITSNVSDWNPFGININRNEIFSKKGKEPSTITITGNYMFQDNHLIIYTDSKELQDYCNKNNITWNEINNKV